MLITLIIGGAIFTYLLWYKPEIIAVLLFTLMIARINIDLPGLPMNLRALITLAVFGRILIDKPALRLHPRFLNSGYARLFVIYLLYIIIVSLWHDLFNMDLFKESISSVIAVFSVYHFYFRSGNDNILKAAMIISGVSCFADLAYTYIDFGTFPVRRLYYPYVGLGDLSIDELNDISNHNFYGQICAMAFVYIFGDIVKNKSARTYTIFLLPVMFLGILMSTSRSALIGAVVMAVFYAINGINYRDQKRRVYKLGAFVIGFVVIGFLVLGTVTSSLQLDSKFSEEITARLVEEPVAMVKRAFGESYNVQNLGSMDWREESSENAYNAYMNFSIPEQVFGIGNNGYQVRDIGQGYNAHNAMLLILIEYGIVGMCMFTLIMLGVLVKSILVRNFSPSFAILCFTLIYGAGQNKEWTSPTTFLFLFTVVAEIKMIFLERRRLAQKHNQHFLAAI